MKSSKSDRFLFLGIAIWFLAVIIWGFSPSFYFRSSAEEPLKAAFVYHGIFATGWYLIFFVQCLLLNLPKYRKLHFRLGWMGALILLATFVSGVKTSFVQANDDAVSIGYALIHFLLVLGFAGVGILYRKRSFIHKRLLVFASTILSSAAVARIDFFGFRVGETYYTYYAIMFAAVIVLVIYDLIVYKKVFKVNWICGIISYLVVIHSYYIWESQVWGDIIHQIMGR